MSTSEQHPATECKGADDKATCETNVHEINIRVEYLQIEIFDEDTGAAEKIVFIDHPALHNNTIKE